MRSSGNSGGGQGGTDCSQAGTWKCNSGCCAEKNTLYIIGIGPGSPDHMSVRAIDMLKSCDTIAGYTTYIDLVRNIIGDSKIINTGMKKEVDRVKAAIDVTVQGESCALVCSGDPGIYAMAGLALEICSAQGLSIARNGTDIPLKSKGLKIEIVPGISALSSGGSLLGAPLTHDFAVISLSDLLTPWEVIEKRLDAAASADFVIVLFNPKSKKRDWQLGKAKEIILKYRDETTPVGIATGAMRENEKIEITTLRDLDKADVGMQTTVFIGNSTSMTYLEFMFTPRGYAGKYEIDK